jgi:hypothetical protein
MTDFQLLVLILSLIYLSDCCLWVRRGSVVFRSIGTGRYTVVHPSRLWGNDRGGAGVPQSAAPIFGSCFVCHTWPVSLTPLAMYSFVAQCTDPAGRATQRRSFFRFSDVRGIWQSDCNVMVNGEPFLKLPDETRASYYAKILTELWQSSPSDRQDSIDAAITDRCAKNVAQIRNSHNLNPA